MESAGFPLKWQGNDEGPVLGGSAESWLTQQVYYDPAQVRIGRIKVKRLVTA